jgi:hypothetical protein
MTRQSLTGEGERSASRRVSESASFRGLEIQAPEFAVSDDLKLEKLVGGGAVEGWDFGLDEAQIDG